MKKMKLLLVALIVFVGSQEVSGQVTIRSYANFILEDRKLIWQKVFERPSTIRDSLKKVVGIALKQNSIFKNIDETSEGFEVDISDWTMDYKRYGGPATLGYPTVYRDGKWSSRLVIQIKDEKYRVTAYDLSFGSLEVSTYYGYGVSSTKDISGRWDETILSKDRNTIKKARFENCDFINTAYLDIFDFKEKKALKSDF